jgi:hypothetical protein
MRGSLQALTLLQTWGGGSDSYMEYLIKAGILLGDDEYKRGARSRMRIANHP